MLQTIEKAIKQYGVSLVCIDNLMTAMDSVRDHNDLYLAQSNFVGGVKKLAKKYDISVILVAHVRKASAGVRDFDNDEVSGSADVTNKVDVVINYKKEDESSGANGSISITKNRFGGEIITGNNRIMMMYSPETKRVIEMNNRGVREYSWTKLLKRNEDEANGMIPVDDIDVPF